MNNTNEKQEGTLTAKEQKLKELEKKIQMASLVCCVFAAIMGVVNIININLGLSKTLNIILIVVLSIILVFDIVLVVFDIIWAKQIKKIKKELNEEKPEENKVELSENKPEEVTQENVQVNKQPTEPKKSTTKKQTTSKAKTTSASKTTTKKTTSSQKTSK